MHEMMKRTNPIHGVTLLEMLLAAFVMSIIAVSTAGVLGDGRVLRERARHRAELALTVQSELDRLRAQPAAQLHEGRQTVRRAEWPPSVSAEEIVRKRADGTLELNVPPAARRPAASSRWN